MKFAVRLDRLRRFESGGSDRVTELLNHRFLAQFIEVVNERTRADDCDTPADA